VSAQPWRWVGRRGPVLVAGLGVLALAVDPLGWLLESWDNHPMGAVVALGWVGLLLQSVRSGGRLETSAWAPLLLAVSVGVRLLGRLSGIHIVGSMVLVVDALALSLWLGTRARPWPVHPVFATVFFALALPLHAVVDRFVGYPARLVAAQLVAWTVGAERQGAGVVGAVTLHVDAPCSGVQGLVMLLALGAAVAAVRRPSWAQSRRAEVLVGLWVGFLATCGAVLANWVRLTGLYGSLVGGLDLFAEPAHSLWGTVALGVGALHLLGTTRRWVPWPSSVAVQTRRPTHPLAHLTIGTLALVGVLWPMEPWQPTIPTAQLPAGLGAYLGHPLDVTDDEHRYLDRVGVSLEKVRCVDGFDSRTVLMARGASPLRLHDPSACLQGRGWVLESLGEWDGAAHWSAETPEGEELFVRLRYLAPETGRRAATAAEAAWQTVQHPDGGGWLMILQLHPLAACASDGCAALDAELLGVLEG
jgi:exosortase/archaeosortase family protein